MKKTEIYKIVQIINQSTFIINAGYEQGIKEKDKFIIVGNKKNVILDPDNGNVIEELPTSKAEIFAKTVYEKVSICKTEWISPYHSAGLSTLVTMPSIISQSISDSLGPHDVAGHYKELDIREEDSKILDDHDDSPIALGDKVRQVQ